MNLRFLYVVGYGHVQQERGNSPAAYPERWKRWTEQTANDLSPHHTLL